MALVNFYRGLREKYSPDTHKDGLYFSTDTLEIILNGSSFGGGLTNVEFSEGKLIFSFANGTVKEVPIDEATQDLPGLLSALDKQKLDNLPTGTEITEDISGLEEKVGTNNYSGSNYLEGETNLTDAVKELDTQLKTANDSLSQSIEQLDQETIKEVQLDGVAITPSDNKVNIPLASPSADGVMSSEDKTKLNKIVDTGDGTKYLTDNGTYVPLDKNSVELGNVDNTSDLDKPISTATQNALDGKVDKSEGKSLVADTLITKLEQLDDKATIDAALADKIPLAQKGVASGVATLDENGKVPVEQLNGTLAKVFGIEKAIVNQAALPEDATEGQRYYTIDTKKIYERLTDSWDGGITPKEDTIYNFRKSDATGSEDRTNILYRWDGADLVEISSSLALGETSGTAYAGDKGKQVTDRVAEVYSANSVVNGLSDIIFDSDDTRAQTLSADNALKTWDGSGTSHDMKIPYATSLKAGVMSAADKTKLEGIATDITNAVNALDATVTSTDGTNVQVKVTETNGKITAVNITKDDTAKNADLTAEVTRATTAEGNIQTALDNHKADQDKKHIPAGGHERQILSWKASGEAKWEDLANVFTGLEEILAYGVQWDTTVGNPELTRIGNMSLHKTLPIQSQLKGCIAQGDQIMYWLDEEDWRWRKDPITQQVTLAIADTTYTITADIFSDKRFEKQWIKINDVACQISSIATDTNTATLVTNDDLTGLSLEAGNIDIELGAVLNGYDGTVRIYVPYFYIKSYSEGNTRKVYISTVQIDSTWTMQHEILVDAYRCTVLNTVPEDMGYLSTLPVNSAISVVNTESYCRGGGNRSANDTYLETDPFRTDLGKPRTSTTRANMRTYARNTTSELLSYEQYKNIFYWLWVIEYANFNSQATFNDALTSEGYRQGGMGNGITIVNGNYWNYYNGYYPLTPCGYGNQLGNRTGLVDMQVTIPTTPGGNPTQVCNLKMPRWRGFDNPFGDIWTNLDGIIVDADANNHGNNMDYVYTCNDPSKFGDTLTEDYVKTAESIHQDGYVKAFDLGETANIIASQVGGSATTYMCDSHWTGDKNATLRTVRVGGRADDSTRAGLGYLSSGSPVSYPYAAVIGFRSASTFVSAEQQQD